jgi:hypothetical protein
LIENRRNAPALILPFILLATDRPEFLDPRFAEIDPVIQADPLWRSADDLLP